MNTLINIYDKETGELKHSCLFTANTKQALINHIRQAIHNDYNTWNYPEHIEGIKESTTKQGVLYYEYENQIIQAIPQ
jgi:hypothetical protein